MSYSIKDLHLLIKEQCVLERKGKEILKVGKHRKRLCEIQEEEIKEVEDEIERIKKAGWIRQFFYDHFEEGGRKNRRVRYYREYEGRKAQWMEQYKEYAQGIEAQDDRVEDNFVKAFEAFRQERKITALSETLLSYIEKNFCSQKKRNRNSPEFKVLHAGLRPPSGNVWKLFWRQIKRYCVGPAKVDTVIAESKERLLLFVADWMSQRKEQRKREQTLEEGSASIIEDALQGLEEKEKKILRDELEQYRQTLLKAMCTHEQPQAKAPQGMNLSDMSDEEEERQTKDQIIEIVKDENITEEEQWSIVPHASSSSVIEPPIAPSQGLSDSLSKKYEKLKQEVIDFLDSVKVDLDEESLKELEKLRKKASLQLHPDKNPQDNKYAEQLFKAFTDFLEQRKKIKQGAQCEVGELGNQIRELFTKIAVLKKTMNDSEERSREMINNFKKQLSEQGEQLKQKIDNFEKQLSERGEQRKQKLDNLEKQEEQSKQRIDNFEKQLSERGEQRKQKLDNLEKQGEQSKQRIDNFEKQLSERGEQRKQKLDNLEKQLSEQEEQDKQESTNFTKLMERMDKIENKEEEKRQKKKEKKDEKKKKKEKKRVETEVFGSPCVDRIETSFFKRRFEDNQVVDEETQGPDEEYSHGL